MLTLSPQVIADVEKLIVDGIAAIEKPTTQDIEACVADIANTIKDEVPMGGAFISVPVEVADVLIGQFVKS